MTTPIDDVLDDVRAEYAQLESILDSLTSSQWEAPSMAPGWSVADTVLHLALTEELVVVSLERRDGGWTTRDRPLDEVVDGHVRENSAPAPEIFGRWRAACRASLDALAAADPDRAVTWAAAPLKPRTLATTRLAEHWAHGLDITEALGIANHDTDRLRHIAWLGHATLPYAMRLADLEPVAVCCTLTAPSGAVFTYGPSDATATISGEMGTFCRVGARRLPASESELATSGPDADAALAVLRNYAA
ncbi:MAG: maleylpyruvate isomerase family mycothiol-dependent enzyme [Ilumatobacter sp.]|nr:maleylpyruvate isomerase family mycothiol-dependent enzyme [Ilumatobacter sp.]